MNRIGRWIERKLGGHFSIGKMTIFGANAMHWGVNIHTRRWGYICFRLPLPCFGRWWPLYFYLSPNGTPWAATLLIGGGHSNIDKRAAQLRHTLWGHGYNCNAGATDPQRPSAYLDSITRVLKSTLSADSNDYPFELQEAWLHEIRAANDLPADWHPEMYR